jgi:hypothetical protein
MGPIFAIRTDGLIFDNEFGIVVGWIVALGDQPAGVYCSVPQRLLPEGVSAAYVDVHTAVSAMPAELFAAIGHPLPAEYVPDVRALNEIAMRSRIPRGPYFALRADGRRSDITNEQLVEWFCALFPAPPAEDVVQHPAAPVARGRDRGLLQWQRVLRDAFPGRNPGSCDPGSCDPGSCDPGSCDPGRCDPGQYDQGRTATEAQGEVQGEGEGEESG